MIVDTEHTPIPSYDFIDASTVNTLSPISHSEGVGLYRVPVSVVGEDHTIFVGDHHIRMFDSNTLPDFIKHKLAMIIMVKNQLGRESILRGMSRHHLYSAPDDSDMKMIGWHAFKDMYIVIMTNDELESLKR